MPAMEQIERRFVVPFYLHVLHGNMAAAASPPSGQDEIVRKMRAVAGDVTFDIAVRLWSQGWREAI